MLGLCDGTETESPTRYSGREFTAKELALVREVVENCSGLSRTELARTVCELLGWKRQLPRARGVGAGAQDLGDTLDHGLGGQGREKPWARRLDLDGAQVPGTLEGIMQTETRIGRLILVPAVLRLAGEVTNGLPAPFSRAVGGGAAAVGIIWLVPVFGIYFARRLAREGSLAPVGRSAGLAGRRGLS